MITVELRRIPEGHNDYTTVATLTVNDDGAVTIDDPEQYLPVDMHVLVKGADGPRRVTFDEDPDLWARNLHRALRTGYLVPVIVHDDGAPTARTDLL